jgi:hypothetical protein
MMEPETPIVVTDVMSERAPAWKLALGALQGVNAAGEALLALSVQSPLYPPPESNVRVSRPPM